MPTTSIVAFPGRLILTDAAGAPCPGAQLHIAGAKREVMALYADAAHVIPLPNPVLVDAAGMLPLMRLASWADKALAKARTTRNQVRVGRKVYSSTRTAWKALDLPPGRCIAFRGKLKAAGKLTFTDDSGKADRVHDSSPTRARLPRRRWTQP